MRVISGEWRGRKLLAPKNDATRPTADRTRETLFSMLASRLGSFEGLYVADLFAGSGALGIEALSRGARFCLFVEEAAEARGLIHDNVEKLAQTGATKLWRRDATRLGRCAPMEPFDLAFLDPPYGKGLADAALAAMAAGGWTKPGAIVVVEEVASAEIAIPAAFETIDSRDQGETRLLFLRDVSGVRA